MKCEKVHVNMGLKEKAKRCGSMSELTAHPAV
jgi:hypothetical protein